MMCEIAKRKIMRVIVKAVCLLLFLHYLVYAQKPISEYTLTPKDLSPPVDYKEVVLHTEDGLKLKCWLLPKGNAKGTVIIAFTDAGNMSNVVTGLPLTGLLDINVNILLFDYRGYGGSEGEVFKNPVDIRYLYDLEAAINFLREDSSFKKLPIGILGLSRGAVLSFAAAKRNPKVKAIVCNGVYSSTQAFINHWNLIFEEKLQEHWNFPSELDPIAVAQLLDSCAVYLIADEKDVKTPPTMALDIFTALTGPKEIWIVPYSKHLRAFEVDSKKYRTSISDFFRKWLID